MSVDTSRPPLVFIFDHVRLRSHLFFRFLSTSPNAQPIYHPYLNAGFFGPERHEPYWKPGAIEVQEGKREQEGLVYPDADTFADATRKLVKAVSDAQAQGKLPLANEHWPNVLKRDLMLGIARGQISEPSALGQNPTHLPDDLLDSLKPAILIRHPVNSVDSIYRSCLTFRKQRPGDEQFGALTANKPLRILFDYFQSRPGQQPIVVDGDDILWRTDSVSRRLCDSFGLGKLSETWSPTSQEQIDAMDPWVFKVTQHIHESYGIDRPEGGPPGPPDIDSAVKQWAEKYGQDIADQLKALVMENMPHYEYLQQFKI